MEKTVKCPFCKADDAQKSRVVHHFLESGLDNVYLNNVEMIKCPHCGEEVVRLPHSVELMRCIAQEVILVPRALSSKEIRFLRKSLHLKSQEFADLIGVDRVSMSRWENDNASPEKVTDRFIRLICAVKIGLEKDMIDRLIVHFEKTELELQAGWASRDFFVPIPDDSQPGFTCPAPH